MFLFKKILASLLMPMSFCLLILMAGLGAFLLKKKKAAKILVSCAVGLMVLSTFEPLSHQLLRPIERAYPPYKDTGQSVGFVLVLGGGIFPDTTVPLSSQLNYDSLSRLVEGMRIYREQEGSKLIFSGAGKTAKRSCADVMAAIAESQGIEKASIITEPRARDTREEALMIKKIVGEKPFVMVTSASHMRRAVAIFRKQGLNPIPAPTCYKVPWRTSILDMRSFGSGGLKQTETAIYETIGSIWAKLRGLV